MHWNFSSSSKLALKHISLVTVATIISGVFAVLFNAFAARAIGPAEFGKYSLVLSISRFLVIPMLFGITTALIKYGSDQSDEKGSAEVLSTATVTVTALSLLSASIFLIGTREFSALFHIDVIIFSVAVIYSFVSTFSQFGRSFLQTRKKFRVISILEIVSPLIAIIVLSLCFLVYKELTFTSPVYAIAAGFFITAVVSAIYIKKNLTRLNFDFNWSKKILSYSKYSAFATLSTFLMVASDKLILNKFYPLAVVGIYTAYFTASQAFSINKLLVSIWTVISPSLSSSNHGKQGHIILRKNVFLIMLGIFAISFLSILGLIYLFGHEFPLIFNLAVLFSISSSLAFAVGLYTLILNSHDLKGRKFTAWGSFFFAMLNLILNYFLIPKYGMYGGASVLIITNLLLLIYLEIVSAKFKWS